MDYDPKTGQVRISLTPVYPLGMGGLHNDSIRQILNVIPAYQFVPPPMPYNAQQQQAAPVQQQQAAPVYDDGYDTDEDLEGYNFNYPGIMTGPAMGSAAQPAVQQTASSIPWGTLLAGGLGSAGLAALLRKAFQTKLLGASVVPQAAEATPAPRALPMGSEPNFVNRMSNSGPNWFAGNSATPPWLRRESIPAWNMQFNNPLTNAEIESMRYGPQIPEGVAANMASRHADYLYNDYMKSENVIQALNQGDFARVEAELAGLSPQQKTQLLSRLTPQQLESLSRTISYESFLDLMGSDSAGNVNRPMTGADYRGQAKFWDAHDTSDFPERANTTVAQSVKNATPSAIFEQPDMGPIKGTAWLSDVGPNRLALPQGSPLAGLDADSFLAKAYSPTDNLLSDLIRERGAGVDNSATSVAGRVSSALENNGALSRLFNRVDPSVARELLSSSSLLNTAQNALGRGDLTAPMAAASVPTSNPPKPAAQPQAKPAAQPQAKPAVKTPKKPVKKPATKPTTQPSTPEEAVKRLTELNKSIEQLEGTINVSKLNAGDPIEAASKGVLDNLKQQRAVLRQSLLSNASPNNLATFLSQLKGNAKVGVPLLAAILAANKLLTPDEAQASPPSPPSDDIEARLKANDKPLEPTWNPLESIVTGPIGAGSSIMRYLANILSDSIFQNILYGVD